MTIFTAPKSFEGYQLTAVADCIETAFLNAALPIGYQKLMRGVLLRLECFLQVHDETLALRDLGRPSGRQIIVDFGHALRSTRFHTASESRAAGLVRCVYITLEQATESFSGIYRGFANCLDPANKNSRPLTPGTLNEERLQFWRGWKVVNKKGRQMWLPLHGVYTRYGPQFAADLHVAFSQAASRCASDKIACGRVFLRFLEDQPPSVTPENFESQEWVGQLLTTFLTHFMTMETVLKRPGVALREYREFALILERHLLGRAWPFPDMGIPKPYVRKVRGADTNIRISSGGTRFKSNSLTEVPLEISDTSARELLLSRIQDDFHNVTKWARVEVDASWTRHNNAREIAKARSVIEASQSAALRGLPQEERLAYASWIYKPAKALFERGILGLRHYRVIKIRSSETAWELGLPTSGLLLAYATVLIGEHPSITSSFLQNLELENESGERAGFVRTDAGAYLVGYKRRRGPNLAQQRILLNTTTATLVERLIEITSPLRQYAKEHSAEPTLGRRLFLCIATVGRSPSAWRPVGEAHRLTEWLETRLTLVAGIPRQQARELAVRFSPKSVRGSAAIVKYIDEKSVQAVAEHLGHASWRPELIDHYLPLPLQQIFNERWIRIFQTALICNAMQGSPYLLDASAFKSLTQLEEFLQNHAISFANIVTDNQTTNSDIDRVIFNVDASVLATMFSIERAVSSRPESAGPVARKWSRFSAALRAHLRDIPEFWRSLQIAEKRANPEEVLHLIHE